MTSIIATAPVGAAAKPARALDALRRTLALAGWDIEHLDLDLTGTGPVADIRLVREDGRWLLARVDALGRCSIEAFHREIGLGVPANHRGRHARFPLVEDVFLGRTRHEGPRAMLRHLTRYLADNALWPVPAARPMREEWALSVRDRCAAAGAAFTFKQWGAWGPDGVRRDRKAPTAGCWRGDGGTSGRRYGERCFERFA